jgi:hypothetical protein
LGVVSTTSAYAVQFMEFMGILSNKLGFKASTHDKFSLELQSAIKIYFPSLEDEPQKAVTTIIFSIPATQNTCTYSTNAEKEIMEEPGKSIYFYAKSLPPSVFEADDLLKKQFDALKQQFEPKSVSSTPLTEPDEITFPNWTWQLWENKMMKFDDSSDNYMDDRKWKKKKFGRLV